MNSKGESSFTEKQACMYMVGGVEITFPHKAYPSQLSMMDKIIRGLVRKQNCLLESPTGSGKSLALLCSALAWRRKAEKEYILLTAEFEAQLLNELPQEVLLNTENCNDFSKQNFPNGESASKNLQIPNIDINSYSHGTKVKYAPFQHPVFIDDDDFKPMARGQTSNTPFKSGFNVIGDSMDSLELSPLLQTNIPCKTSSSHSNSSAAINSVVESDADVNHSPITTDVKSTELKKQVLPKKPPKIYFGTRTHKQISQIIRELKKTIYKDAKMTILSSREQTCINSYVLRAANKQEACNELIYDIDGPGCVYHRNYRKVSHFNPSKLSEAFDIEDLIKYLKYPRACPYFSARALVVDSEIVFCPYNYLIDPLIRSSLDIILKNNVIILDEAHNLEDSAREAASLVITHLQVIDAIGDITQVAPACGDASPNYFAVGNILSAFHGWFSDSMSLLKQSSSYDLPSKIYSGEEMIVILDNIGVGPDNFSVFEKHVGVIIKEESDMEIPKERLKLSGGTLFLLKSFSFTLNFIYRDNLRYMPDYRCILTKQRSKYQNAGVRMESKSNSDLSVNFCCLNPAVAFSDIKGNIHTLVVASGTLSPMASFQSELGMPFEITLEANHVVSRSQMWVGTIGHGSSGAALAATYHNTETYAFQDEIGNLVSEICSIIPYGVLCFVSSYGMLDKLASRWQITGLWQHLETRKLIVCEPKGQSKNFDACIREFYNAVEEGKNRGDRGALLIAVCRGKVSEGLDFADDSARAVITIGIPFPSIKDTQIDLKRKYNDANFSKKEIMSGSEWYEAQAFRALNQALGRCIRHRNDFGALIMIDERFQKQPRYVGSLSKWIRKEIIHYRTAVDAFNSLKEFSSRTGMSQVRAIDDCDNDVSVTVD